MGKYVFIDRDGVIIKDTDYVYRIEDVEFIPEASEALMDLQKEFTLVIVTNQSGVGRGYYKAEDFFRVNMFMLDQLEEEGVKIKTTLYCLHSPKADCDCRKPKTKLIKDFIGQKKWDKKNSYIIGDKTSDIKMGADLGIKTVLVKTGKAGQDKLYDVQPDFIVADLREAANKILGVEK